MKRFLFVTCFIAFSFFLNLDMFNLSHPAFVYKDFDDNWYGITLKYAKTNSCSKGIPVSFMYKDLPNFHSCLFLKVLNAAVPINDINVQVKYLIIFGRVITLAIFMGIAFLLTGSPLASFLISAIILLDPGITNFKFIFSAIDQLFHHRVDISYTRLSRFISPLQYAIPGYLSLLTLLLTSFKKISFRNSVIVLIPCLILLSLTPFYVWIPFYSAYVIGFIYFYLKHQGDDRSFHTKLWGGAIILGSLFSIFYLFGKIGLPHQEEALLRSSFIKGFFSPLFVFHKTFLISLSLLALCVHRYFKTYLFTIISFLTPFLILNINVITGLEYQNFHFKDYLAPMIYLAITILLFNILKKFSKHYQSLLSICFIALSANYYQIQKTPTEFSQRFPHIFEDQDLIDYLKNNSPKRIYCSDLYPLIPVLTDNRCFYHHLLMTYPLDSNLLVEMNAIQFYLSDAASEMVKKRTSERSASLATYNYGILPEWGSKYPANQRFSSPEALKEYGEKWKQYYEENKVSLLKKYLPYFDEFIFPNTQAVLPNFFVKIKEFKNYSLYRLNN